MLAVFLAYKDVIQDGGLVRGCKGASMLQNYPLASLHMQNWCSESSTAIIFPVLFQDIWCLCHNVLRKFP